MSHDLTLLTWQLSGWRPYGWKHARSVETTFWLEAEVGPVPARLPGSVQQALRDATILPDWNRSFGSKEIEWVEHKHWVYSVVLPREAREGLRGEERVYLKAESLDYSGWVLVNGRVAGEFCGPHRPVEIELTSALSLLPREAPVELALVFATPPEAYGQIGYTSDTKALKPRYGYSWDWCPRLVALGARGGLCLEGEGERLVSLVSVVTRLSETLIEGAVEVVLEVASGVTSLEVELAVAGRWTSAKVEEGRTVLKVVVERPALWWPNGEGEAGLHELVMVVRDADGQEMTRLVREVGFKHVAWRSNPGASSDALPWLCVVNGRPIFLQGVNWTPVRLAYQDVKREEYNRLVESYREMGCNVLRVWGGAFLEAPEFFEACDRAGLLVWQEFPLSSSGLDNQPPLDGAVVAELCDIARHYIRARRHHASLLLWCGGNELQEGLEYEKHAGSRPCDLSNPCLAALAAVVEEEDAGRRFVPTSPSGPSFCAKRENFGQGLHHHVHGPWGFGDFPAYSDWETYWENDDSTFRSETGLPSANRLELMKWQAAGEPLWPPTTPIWKHSAAWWTQAERLEKRFRHLGPEEALAAYVEQTQREQADGLAHAARCSKARFPQCGGFLVWMGHDCFPCPANTSIIDAEHRPKPAYHALRAVFQEPTRGGMVDNTV